MGMMMLDCFISLSTRVSSWCFLLRTGFSQGKLLFLRGGDRKARKGRTGLRKMSLDRMALGMASVLVSFYCQLDTS